MLFIKSQQIKDMFKKYVYQSIYIMQYYKCIYLQQCLSNYYIKLFYTFIEYLIFIIKYQFIKNMPQALLSQLSVDELLNRFKKKKDNNKNINLISNQLKIKILNEKLIDAQIGKNLKEYDVNKKQQNNKINQNNTQANNQGFIIQFEERSFSIQSNELIPFYASMFDSNSQSLSKVLSQDYYKQFSKQNANEQNFNDTYRNLISISNYINYSQQSQSKMTCEIKEVNKQLYKSISYVSQIQSQNSMNNQLFLGELDYNNLFYQQNISYDIKAVLKQYCKQTLINIHGIQINDLIIPQLKYKISKNMNDSDLQQLGYKTFKLFKLKTRKNEIQIIRNETNKLVLLAYRNYIIQWHYDNNYFSIQSCQSDQNNKKLIRGYKLQIYKLGKAIYKGQYYQQSKHGKGIMKWQNGDIHDGLWVNGKKFGPAKYYQAQGNSIINGQYQNNKLNGFCLLKSFDNLSYQGNFINNQKNGFGKQFYQDGIVFQGEHLNNQRNGKGKVLYPNGDIYYGNWKNDIKHGKGQLCSAIGVKHECNWEEGECIDVKDGFKEELLNLFKKIIP